MQRLIPFYLTIIFYSLAFLFSCTKNDTEITNTWREILIRHKWKHYQTRTVITDNTTNTIITDTITQPEICDQNSLFIFAADSVVRRNSACPNPDPVNEGKWYLKADSTFAAPIWQRRSFGTGYVLYNAGLPAGKMKLLTETEFQLLSSSGGFTFGNTTGYNTYYLKAAD
jgi:hypothetical protein